MKLHLLDRVPWLALCLLLAGTALAAEKPTLTLGVYAYRDKGETLARWAPLGEYLSQRLGDVRIEVAVFDGEQMRQAVNHNAVDFLLTTPRYYIELKQESALSGALATLVEEHDGVGVSALGGVIIARREREDLRSLADLRGQRIAVFDKGGFGSLLAPLYEARRAGVEILPKQLQRVGDKQDDVIEAVLAGQVDVGFVRTGVIERLAKEGRLDPGQLRIIHRQDLPSYPFVTSTRLFPEWPFVSLPRVDARLARRIAAALLPLFLAGAASAQTLTIGLAADVTSADPHFHNTSSNNAASRHVFETLIR
ncbi:MAG: PhnD/SsuA/transferrin family substrate-binding protein, partial [Rhodocyclaceae bacterium]|nr:PhnD/SsuA/transferrin family substrate-binding protein [Rhodocyclaceae bacterium]